MARNRRAQRRDFIHHDEGPEVLGDPLEAQLTFQNLLGLWDLLASGPALAHPGPYGPEGPDDAWVEKAGRYLEDMPERERRRLEDSFENRHDALVGGP